MRAARNAAHAPNRHTGFNPVSLHSGKWPESSKMPKPLCSGLMVNKAKLQGKHFANFHCSLGER